MFHDAVNEAMQGQGPHFPPTRKATIHIHRGEGGKGVKMGTLHWGGGGGGLAKPGSYMTPLEISPSHLRDAYLAPTLAAQLVILLTHQRHQLVNLENPMRVSLHGAVTLVLFQFS